MSSLPFDGFARPQSNFYRLPLSWFDTLRTLRTRHDRRRIVALVRLTEYIIKWTWGQGNYQSAIRLTLDEIQNGKVIGRQNGERLRADQGTGLPRKTLIPTIDNALSYGLLTRLTDDRDRARVRQAYAVRLAPEDLPITRETFDGFPTPTSNYFILPNIWTNLTAGVRSDVLILAVEYLFRHCWNWSRQDEVHWLTSDEIANGRLRTSSVSDVPRYDDGIGYAERKVRDALEQAVAHEWVVWRTTQRNGRARTEFTLRRTGWPAGSWQEPQGSPGYAPPESGGGLDGPKVTLGATVRADRTADPTPVSGPNVTPLGPNVTPGGPNVTPARPNVTADGPKVDPDQIYQPFIPTVTTNLFPPPPHSGIAVPMALAGGGVRDQGSIQRADVTSGNRRRLEYFDPVTVERVTIDAAMWAGDWLISGVLPANHVVVCNPELPGDAVVVTAEEAARLLWNGLPREWMCWDPSWLANPPAAGDLAGDDGWDETARQREEMVEDVLAVMRTNDVRWGHWDLTEALARCGIAPERVQDLLNSYGRPLVGAWLADLRHDASVQSVAAVLISNLRKGLTPPSLAWRSKARSSGNFA